MRRSLLVRLFAALTVLAMLGVMASPVSAGKPEKIIVYEEFDDNVCGIPVYAIVDGFLKLHIQEFVIEPTSPESDGFWLGIVQHHFVVTYTNAAGVVLTQFERFTLKDDDLIDNGDGTWTYTYSISGQAVGLRSGNKTVLVDVGRISFELKFYLGELSTQTDNYFISETITAIHGPHPVEESDFAASCEVFTEIMG